MKFLIKTTGFINFDDYEAYILEGYIDCTNKSILQHIEYIKNHKSKTVLNIKIYQYLGTIFLQKNLLEYQGNLIIKMRKTLNLIDKYLGITLID